MLIPGFSAQTFWRANILAREQFGAPKCLARKQFGALFGLYSHNLSPDRSK
jgi:hypothetical protein